MDPHERDINGAWRLEDARWAQDAELVSGLEVTDHAKLALILRMSALGPRIGHIDEAHTFKTNQIDVGGAVELSLDNRSDGTHLTNESTPMFGGRKGEALLLSETCCEWWPDTDTFRVVGNTARNNSGSLLEGKAGERKGATKDMLTRREASEAACARARPVCGAI